MTKGIIIGGSFGSLLLRQKSDEGIELGEILVSETGNKKILMQVYDLSYGSQISKQNIELISGMNLEENIELNLKDEHLRNYNLALMKNILTIENGKATICKELPKFLSKVREINEQDLDFLTKPKNPLFVGMLRSGSKVLKVPLFLDGKKVFTHHILVAATTGRGKSNLTSCILWDSVDKDYCGILVLDPHDEYYGRNKFGLKDHKNKEKVVYYSVKNVPPGCKTLKINLKNIKPYHFEGVLSLSIPQYEAMNAYYKKYKDGWIKALVLGEEVEVSKNFSEATINVLKRKLMDLLDLSIIDQSLFCDGIFDLEAGESTIHTICNELEEGRVVIVDTSSFEGNTELLIGSMISYEIMKRYRNYKARGLLREKPVILIVLEEAPRVLGKEVLEKGSNIFSTIAREGRKFKIGLYAITQLPSLIPREILANMNTKIILGIEMKPERQAIIESSAQDLSTEDRNIASLDIGEAIISSNFSKFALPVKIPLFEDLVKEKKQEITKKEFSGVNLE